MKLALNQPVNEHRLTITSHSADLSVPTTIKMQELQEYYNKLAEYQGLILYRHEGMLGEKPRVHLLSTARLEISVVTITPRPLYTGELAPVYSEQGAGWATQPVWAFWG